MTEMELGETIIKPDRERIRIFVNSLLLVAVLILDSGISLGFNANY
jgi:hypothetical protein